MEQIRRNDVLATLNKAHPRLFLTDARLVELTEAAETDRRLARYISQVLAQAEECCSWPDIKLNPETGRAETTGECVEMAKNLALAWRLTRDEAYAERLREQLLILCRLPDWHPSHFLNTAKMAYAVSVGYDWLYEYLDTESRRLMVEALVNNALMAGLREHRERSYWTTRVYNWNNVCNSGLIIAALAVADVQKDIAVQVLVNAIEGLPKAINTYGQDGAWPEGVGYWNFATRYTVAALSALDTALGKDFGLSLMDGLAETACFLPYLTGPTGKTFNFADAKTEPPDQVAFTYWLARRYQRPEFVALEDQRVDSGKASADHVIWYWRPEEEKPFEGKVNKLFDGIVQVAVFRSAWDDPEALFVCIKSGHNRVGHAQLDLGSFVMDALGVRWAMDLGGDTYALPGYFDKFDNDGRRWTYYRSGSLSHNVPVLDGANQEVRAGARIARFTGDSKDPFAIVDLSEAYKAGATRVMRGLAIVDNRRAVLVQDEITLTGKQEVAWSMTTEANIEVDGSSATLTQDGKTLKAEIVSPSSAKFTVESAEQKPPEATNEGVRRLMVRLPKQSGQVRLTVLLSPVWPDGVAAGVSSIKPLAEW